MNSSMSSRKKTKRDTQWSRVGSAINGDSIRISVPRAFLPVLTHFFHHVSDALAGDDRPDHGLAMMRQSREYYRAPFYFLYGKLRRAEKKMRGSHHRKALQLFQRYQELEKNLRMTKKYENRSKQDKV